MFGIHKPAGTNQAAPADKEAEHKSNGLSDGGKWRGGTGRDHSR